MYTRCIEEPRLKRQGFFDPSGKKAYSHSLAMRVQKLSAVCDLIRLSKQYGTLLLMFPSLWALFVAAEGLPPWPLMIVFVLGAFLMRSAGCVINDIADQHLDRQVCRTKDRPIASGRLPTLEAFSVFMILIG